MPHAADLTAPARRLHVTERGLKAGRLGAGRRSAGRAGSTTDSRATATRSEGLPTLQARWCLGVRGIARALALDSRGRGFQLRRGVRLGGLRRERRHDRAHRGIEDGEIRSTGRLSSRSSRVHSAKCRRRCPRGVVVRSLRTLRQRSGRTGGGLPKGQNTQGLEHDSDAQQGEQRHCGFDEFAHESAKPPPVLQAQRGPHGVRHSHGGESQDQGHEGWIDARPVEQHEHQQGEASQRRAGKCLTAPIFRLTAGLGAGITGLR